MDPVPSIGHLSQTFLLEEERQEHKMPLAESKSEISINTSEHNSAALRAKNHLTESTKLHCDTSLLSSLFNFSSIRRVFLFYITVQMDFIANTFIDLSDTMARRFATSLEWRQLQSRKFPSDSSDESWDSSLSSSSSIQDDDDDLSVNSASSSKTDYLQAQSEELLTPASFLPTNMEGDADEWGHFADFQEFESLSALSSMADPFQSLSKTFLRRRGAKVSVCKLEQLQEVDSFVAECE